jgi:SAM-dependent methyltransferase
MSDDEYSSASNMAAAPEPAAQRVFAYIYRHATWGTNAQGEGHSGPGSTLHATLIYRTFLQQFLKDNAIRSVVDAGCGDWEFSQRLDWSGIDYKGFDVVESAIAKAKTFAKPNIAFFVGNVVELGLPPADLLLCKHVLQHLPTRDVRTFLTQIKKYRHVLLTNSVNVQTMSATNVDVAVGECRALDPTAPPFNLYGAKVLTYWDGHSMNQVVHIAGALAITAISPFGEGEAKVRIESHRFSDVTELTKNHLGCWLAKARRDGRAVEIILDIQGKVFSRNAQR